MGYLELAKANHEDAEKVLRNIERVETAGNRIVGIIKQLSAVAFTTRLPLYELPVQNLIAGAARRTKEETGYDLELELQSEIGNESIHTNVEAFEDSLSKLLANAWESYPEDSSSRPIVLKVAGSADQKNYEFELIDQGSGIDPSVEENMFEPFISSKNTVGVGMGLTVARHAIRTLGGDIYVRPNKESEGTTVAFTHPVEPIDTA